jgi:hypothetical protein
LKNVIRILRLATILVWVDSFTFRPAYSFDSSLSRPQVALQVVAMVKIPSLAGIELVRAIPVHPEQLDMHTVMYIYMQLHNTELHNLYNKYNSDNQIKEGEMGRKYSIHGWD